MKVSSPAFKNEETIPKKYSAKGENVQPPLVVEDVPDNAKSLAIVIEDPKGPLKRFIHWTVWNIPAEIKDISLEKDVPYPQGKNTMLKHGYLGPCPPFGIHKYFFKVYALDTLLNLDDGASIRKLEKLMSGHIIGKAELVGLYKNK